ncbi:MAG: hypothetical protein WAZ94_03290 [Phycisphaerales bacterium]
MTTCGVGSILPGRNPRSTGGMFYATRTSGTRFPSDLVTMAASHAGDVSGTGYHGNGPSLAARLGEDAEPRYSKHRPDGEARHLGGTGERWQRVPPRAGSRGVPRGSRRHPPC